MMTVALSMVVRRYFASAMSKVLGIAIVFAWVLASAFAALALQEKPPLSVRGVVIYLILWLVAFQSVHIWLRYVAGPFVYAGLLGIGHLALGKQDAIDNIYTYIFLTVGFFVLAILFMVSSKYTINFAVRATIASVVVIFSMSLFRLVESSFGIPICVSLLAGLVIFQRKGILGSQSTGKITSR